MSKKYNLGSKSDMRKFTKDLEKTVLQKAERVAGSMKHEISCPKCKSKIKISIGKQLCPKCSAEIDFKLKS